VDRLVDLKERRNQAERMPIAVFALTAAAFAIGTTEFVIMAAAGCRALSTSATPWVPGWAAR
jgi:hypothetical protein